MTTQILLQIKKMLDNELEKVSNGTAVLYTIDEVDDYLDKVISEYEKIYLSTEFRFILEKQVR